MFEKLRNLAPRFFASSNVMNAIMEAITTIVIVILIDVYILGNDAIINSSTTIGAVVVPILQAVLLIVAILIAIGLLRAGARAGGAGRGK